MSIREKSIPGPLTLTALVVALALTACATDAGSPQPGRGDGPGAMTSSTPSNAAFGAVEIPEVAGEDERLQIGMEATQGLNAFVASDRVVMGEHTVVEMTRTPFLAMSAFTINPDDVERTEHRDDARGEVVITMTNRTGVKTHLPALPRVEIGGLLFVGVDKLVLRYSTRTDRRRPINLRAVAERKAVYHHAEANRRERGGRVLLEMEVLGTGDAAQFHENVRIDP